MAERVIRRVCKGTYLLDGEQFNCRVKAIESQKGRDEKEPWVRYRRQGWEPTFSSIIVIVCLHSNLNFLSSRE